eukprot:GDKK01051781.1.p1 GENE.GDKK01051781.1~~GDKK01051781.1.p1  ORF type:complete len:659 (+),score=255.28 GDKK01051781.1:21-1997(+)
MNRLGKFIRAPIVNALNRISSNVVAIQEQKRQVGGTAAGLVTAAAFGLTAAGIAFAEANTKAETREVVFGNVSDFQEGETYEISVQEGRATVLLAYVDGQFYCTGSSCSHYSAPLIKGVTTRTHVTCPWHDAEFDLKTGYPVNGCGLDPIPTYPVKVKDGKVVATLPMYLLEMVEAKMAKRDPNNKTTFVIVGGGPAGLCCAETLRQDGFTGRIVIVSREKWTPYDRPVLSKNMAALPKDYELRDEAFFKNNDIEFLAGVEGKKLNTAEKSLLLSTGETMKYDKILLATGADPRRIPCEGHQLANIHVMRTPEDAHAVVKFGQPGKKVVVVGSSFIGMECAASLAKMGAHVTVVGMESVPFERVLGPEIGALYAKALVEKKIDYAPKCVIKRYIGSEGKITHVELTNGQVLPCDCAVLGAGVVPATAWLKDTDVAPGPCGGITVDAHMKTQGNDDVFAAGDIARFPFFMNGGTARIEHWDVAMQQGRVAAKNMLGGNDMYFKTPFFWSILFGRSLRYAGHCIGYEEIIIHGELDNFDFEAYLIKKGKVEAVVTMNRDPIAIASCEAIRLGLMPTPDELRSKKKTGQDIVNILKESNKKGFVFPEPPKVPALPPKAAPAPVAAPVAPAPVTAAPVAAAPATPCCSEKKEVAPAAEVKKD